MPSVNIRSELAGTVTQVVIAVGAQVAPDDVLVLLESMKMEIPVLAPRGGRVSSVGVAEGELVGEGDVLVVLEV